MKPIFTALVSEHHLRLTCRGQHGAGEEQRGHKVPVVAGVVTKHRDAIVAGLQGAGQEQLQLLVGHTGVVVQEVPPGCPQLVPELLLVRQLDGGEDPGADDQVQDVSGDQQREVQRRVVSVQEPDAAAVGRTGAHHPSCLLVSL